MKARAFTLAQVPLVQTLSRRGCFLPAGTCVSYAGMSEICRRLVRVAIRLHTGHRIRGADLVRLTGRFFGRYRLREVENMADDAKHDESFQVRTRTPHEDRPATDGQAVGSITRLSWVAHPSG